MEIFFWGFVEHNDTLCRHIERPFCKNSSAVFFFFRTGDVFVSVFGAIFRASGLCKIVRCRYKRRYRCRYRCRFFIDMDIDIVLLLYSYLDVVKYMWFNGK